MSTDWRDNNWRTSSFSDAYNQACVEVAFGDFRKASFSGAGNDCVELGFGATEPVVGIRDTKSRTTGTLVLPDTARVALAGFIRAQH